MASEDTYKYFAFISYNAKDTAWGKRLQRKLEHYKLPSVLCREHGWRRKPINPVFFAPTDIQPGGLDEELRARLRASRHLIVICSPNSARSEWVGREIEYFYSLGRPKNIHFFIVDGVPGSGDEATECFNPAVKRLGIPEILGANVNEKIYSLPWLNRERAYVQLVSKLLVVEFDSIWRRHRRRLFRDIAVGTAAAVCIAAGFALQWRASRPFDATICLREVSVRNDSLPPLKDAVVTLSLGNETKTDTVGSLGDKAVFRNIPHRFLGKDARLTVWCDGWLDTDTTLSLGRDMAVGISRDPKHYGHIDCVLWHEATERFLGDTRLDFDGHAVTTGSNGEIRLDIPLAEQKTRYRVTADTPAVDAYYYPRSGGNAIAVE